MRPSADASAASTTSRRSVRLVLERRAEAVRPGHAGARRTEQHRAAHAGAVTPGRGRGGRDGADIALSDAGCPAGARVAGAHGAALRRGPTGGVGERDGRGGTDVDDIGGSVWIQPVGVTDGESIRSPARLSSFSSTKSRVWVAVWRLGLALGTVDLAMERVSASSGGKVPEVVGRRAEAVSRLGRPAGGDRGVQEGRRGAAARQSAGLLSAARGPRPAPTNPTLNPAACHPQTRT